MITVKKIALKNSFRSLDYADLQKRLRRFFFNIFLICVIVHNLCNQRFLRFFGNLSRNFLDKINLLCRIGNAGFAEY